MQAPTVSSQLKPQFINGEINFKKIHNLANDGFDQMPLEERTLGWLVMLHIYPLNPSNWDQCFGEIVHNYWSNIEKYKLKDWHKNKVSQINIEGSDIDDTHQMSLIHIDIIRMNRYLQYFENQNNLDEYILRIERILYVFAKTISDIGYVQGMNEIVFVFFYLYELTKSVMKNNSDYAEAFVYQSLVNLITTTQLKSVYHINNNAESIVKLMSPLSEIIEENVPEVFNHFKKLNIPPIMYAFNWFVTMFSQLHPILDLFTIWDTLLAHMDCIVEYEYFIALAHLICMKEKLLSSDYGGALILLQGNCDISGSQILQACRKYWIKTHGIIGKIAATFKIP